MLQQTECLKSWIRAQLSRGLFKTVEDVEDAVKAANDEKLITMEVATTTYTPESLSGYCGD